MGIPGFHAEAALSPAVGRYITGSPWFGAGPLLCPWPRQVCGFEGGPPYDFAYCCPETEPICCDPNCLQFSSTCRGCCPVDNPNCCRNVGPPPPPPCPFPRLCGTVGKQTVCCPPGQRCCDPTSHTCCPTSDACVHGACCPSTRVCGDTCCGPGEKCDPATLLCCNDGEVACAGGCCPQGRCAIACSTPWCDNFTDPMGCCPSDRIVCNGHCCVLGGSCINGRCCPPLSVTDCDGTCCRPGSKCCGGGSTGFFPFCCYPGSECCGGTCCWSTLGETCCGGRCCGPGTSCCGGTCCRDGYCWFSRFCSSIKAPF